jgi:hypothetical protein
VSLAWGRADALFGSVMRFAAYGTIGVRVVRPSTKLTVEAVKGRVSFPDIQIAGWTPGSSGEVDDPVFGKMFSVKGPSPVFEPANQNVEPSRRRH